MSEKCSYHPSSQVCPSCDGCKGDRGRSSRPVAILIFVLFMLWRLGQSGQSFWIFDLLSHFQIHYIVGLLICAGLTYIWKARHLTFIALVLAIGISLTLYFSLPVAVAQCQAPAHSLRLLSFNVLYTNSSKQKVADYLKNSNADIIGLYEVNKSWFQYLTKSLKAEYPYVIPNPHGETLGIAFFSKISFSQTRVLKSPARGAPFLEAQIEMNKENQRKLYVLALHPPSPISEKLSRLRDQRLKEVEQWVSAHSDNHLIIMGDFNATPWSFALRHLVRTSGLQHAAGYPVYASWPSVLGTFGIPIDHIYTKNIPCVSSFEVGPSLGSDHKPIMTTVGLPPLSLEEMSH